mgnify:CR=1 FL=1
MNVEVLEEVGKQVNVSELGYMHHAMAGTLRVIRSVHGEHGHFDLVLRGDGHAAANARLPRHSCDGAGVAAARARAHQQRLLFHHIEHAKMELLEAKPFAAIKTYPNNQYGQYKYY